MEIKKPFKLPREFKEKWLHALRSGRYDQGTGKLMDDTNPPKFCCLGVAAMEAGCHEENMIADEGEDEVGIPNEIRGEGEQEKLPEELLQDAKSEGLVGILTSMNDGLTKHSFLQAIRGGAIFRRIPPMKGSSTEKNQYSFKEIADWIEDNVEGYDTLDVKGPFNADQVGPLDVVEPEHDEINRLQAVNDGLNTALTKRDEEIMILKKQLGREKESKTVLQKSYKSVDDSFVEILSVLKTVHNRVKNHDSIFGNRRVLTEVQSDIEDYLRK